MGYQRLLLTRWSRRDALAIFVVVVTVAFLTGATLVVLAAGTQTTTLAEEYDAGGQATYYETMAEGRAAADDDALVVPVASVTEPNGTSAVVAGVPCEQAREFREKTDYSVPCPPDSDLTNGEVGSAMTRNLDGENASQTVRVSPRGESDSILPPYWYVADESVVNRLGHTGVFVIDTTPHAVEPTADGRTPLRSALPFFLTGIQQVITVLGMTAVGTSVLVGITVYGVTRMHTRDRRRTICVVRATGGVPGTLLRLYGIRAGALTAVGTALGYAVGVVLTNVVVNTAIYLGVPTSLTIRVTERAATILLPLYAVIVAIGSAAGVLAAWHVTRRSPTSDAPRQKSSRWGSAVGDVLGRVHRLTLLDWRTLVPSVVPLAAFVTVVVLIASITGVVSPLVQTSGTTITDSNANHLIASRVPTGYADTLEDRGMTASPEILAFGVHDGEPMVIRGVRFASFSRVSDTRLVNGRRPNGPNEAVAGADLTQTHDLSLNDSVTLGGSTKAGFDRVTIVGTYAAPGPFDDQLLVSLPTARHLARVDSGMVQMVRTDSRIEATGKSSAIVGVSVPAHVSNGAAIPVRVQLQNLGSEQTNRRVSVQVGDRRRTRSVSLDGGERRTVVVRLRATRLGRQQVVVANRTRTVRIVPHDTVELHGIPERTPPNSAPLVRVTDVSGNPVRNATVSVGDNETTTEANGTARVQLGESGNATIRATAGNGTAMETVRVSPSATRSVVGQLRVQPRRATLLGRPTALLEVTNPWNETLSRTVTITGTDEYSHRVQLAPGQQTTVSTELNPAAPGSHPVRATVNGRTFDETTYRVVGDDRIVSALATSGETGSTGISRAISTAFGDLDLLVGVFVCLAGLMTVGSTTATIAYTIHSRRRVVGVYRATGASPVKIVAHVLTDALIVGVVATVIAFAVAMVAVSLLAEAGLLILYGVRITPSVTPRVAIGVVAAGVGVMCLSAALVTGALIRASPDSLLSDRPPQTRRPEESRGGPDE
ncbi:FtsX-like permease family protein [Haladaptatus cibarius]|uniref:FtsX-like permease family protein n=1 Tax=Haladaptatus cibarius TaxID=453847 RepID=UPI0006797165|nr:FtsX-like permease family protein [Haladaptatus cibarius]